MAEATDTAVQEPGGQPTAPAQDDAPGREEVVPADGQMRSDSPQTVGEAMSEESLHATARAATGAAQVAADVAPAAAEAPDVGMVMRIPVTLQAVLGEARMSIARLMKLGPGSVVPLNHKVGDPVDVVVNGRLVARGEVVLLDGESERFGISLTEIISPGHDTC